MKTIFTKSLAYALTLSLLPAVGWANKICPDSKGTDLVYTKGSKIEVTSYQPDTVSYRVQSPDLPGEGEVDVTLENLARAVNKIRKNYRLSVGNPQDIVGEIYVTDKDMPTLTEDELNARKGCVRKK